MKISNRTLVLVLFICSTLMLTACPSTSKDSSRTVTGKLVSSVTSPASSQRGLQVKAFSKDVTGTTNICSIQGVSSTGAVASGAVAGDGTFSISISPGLWLFGFLDCENHFIATLVLNTYSVLEIAEGSGAVELGEIILLGTIARPSSATIADVSGSASTDSDSDGIPNVYECAILHTAGGGGTSSSGGETSAPVNVPATMGAASAPSAKDIATAPTTVGIRITCENGWSGSSGGSSTAPMEDELGGAATDPTRGPTDEAPVPVEEARQVTVFSLSNISPFEGSVIPAADLARDGFYINFYWEGSGFGSEQMSLVQSTINNQNIVMWNTFEGQINLTFTPIDNMSFYARPTDASAVLECDAYSLSINGGEFGIKGVIGGEEYWLTNEEGLHTSGLGGVNVQTIRNDYSSCR